MDKPTIVVEVVYALADKQKLLRLSLPRGTTVRQAAMQSGMQVHFPELDLANSPLGIFGKAVAKPDERVNHVDVENHTVGVLFDEAQAPNTLFLYVDLGAASLNIDAKLLWANAAVPTELDGLGCFCKWHDGAVSYRSHVLLDGKPFKGADLATSIVRAVAVAKNQLQLATQ